jgi:hypothetical protein
VNFEYKYRPFMTFLNFSRFEKKAPTYHVIYAVGLDH